MTLSAWEWVDPIVVSAIHDDQLSRHGGGAGVRDDGLVVSALARPRNLAVYGTPDLAELAAAYVYGIIKNHGFIDGSKRTGWVVGALFVELNGRQLEFEPADVVLTIEGVAAGRVDEQRLAAWFRARIR